MNSSKTLTLYLEGCGHFHNVEVNIIQLQCGQGFFQSWSYQLWRVIGVPQLQDQSKLCKQIFVKVTPEVNLLNSKFLHIVFVLYSNQGKHSKPFHNKRCLLS